jgi:hypothetical protein
MKVARCGNGGRWACGLSAMPLCFECRMLQLDRSGVDLDSLLRFAIDHQVLDLLMGDSGRLLYRREDSAE